MKINEDIILNTPEIADLAQLAIKNPASIEQLFNLLSHKKGTIKFRSEKVLRYISNENPDFMYSYFDKFIKLLNSENSILKWGAIFSIANLTSVDTENRFENIFEQYYSGIMDKSMITAANIIKSSVKIIFAKPYLADRISNEILKSETAKYENKGKISIECSNIVFGHAIETFDKIFLFIKDKKKVIRFVKMQLLNKRRAVAKKAVRFVKKYCPENP